jgi:hypothetical protein
MDGDCKPCPVEGELFSGPAEHVIPGMKGRTGHLDDWVAETPESIAARLESARSAQGQSRRTMGVMSVISMMMLIASYNAYLSYDTTWILDLPQKELAGGTTVAGVLTDQALKDWAASRSVQVPLLGIRTSVDDAPVLGTATLLVLAFWLVLLTRRENHTVGLLLRDTDTDPSGDDRSETAGRGPSYSSAQRWLIFHTVASNSVFITCDRSLAPVQSLGSRCSTSMSADRGFKAWMSEQAFAFLSRFFFDFPVIVSSIVFVLDRWSYFEPDAFTVNAQAPGVGSAFFWFSMAVFFVCWIPLVMCCRRARLYSEATGRVLKEYGTRLRGDLLRHQTTASQARFTQPAISRIG